MMTREGGGARGSRLGVWGWGDSERFKVIGVWGGGWGSEGFKAINVEMVEE